ncbi:MAG: hypothetical protein ACWGOX_03600 [Desulforhopalus sp.]
MDKSTIDVEKLGKVTVFNEGGERLQLAGLWQNGSAALIFIRHFG